MEVPHFCKHDLRRGVAIGRSEHNVLPEPSNWPWGSVLSIVSHNTDIFQQLEASLYLTPHTFGAALMQTQCLYLYLLH